MWDASKCDLCGDCLVACRYVDYDKDKAASEIKLLMEGKPADILNSCITCNACYETCPTGADPADLIGKMQEKIGTLPIVANSKPLLDGLAKILEEGNGDSQFIEGDPGKPVLSFDSFAFNQFPEGTLESEMFKGMSVVRGTQYMSLVGLVHMGGASFAEKYARKVIGRLAELGRDIVYIHNEGYALAHVKARELGIDVPYHYMHLFDYLRGYFKENKERVTRLNKKIAYQTNCADRWLPEQDAWFNEVLEHIGVQRVQRRYEGKEALCCSGPLIRTNRELAVKIQEDNVRDAINSGADAMVTICPMCDWVMRRPTSQHGLPKIFITDLCRMALGEVTWPDN
jgi:Fe-S oxidoreductase